MQLIELYRRQGFHLLENKILIPEMAGNIQHKTPVREAGIVVHGTAAVHLRERLQRPEAPCFRIGLYPVALGRYRKKVGLLPGKSRQRSRPAGKRCLPNLPGKLFGKVGSPRCLRQLNRSGNNGENLRTGAQREDKRHHKEQMFHKAVLLTE